MRIVNWESDITGAVVFVLLVALVSFAWFAILEMV